ncbi:MAG: rhodanese-like domain-containing protein [Eubacterium sp.]|nr:rhodanese-like domain-containing protein [Eubacterium sp.]
MGLLDLFKMPNINDKVKEYKATSGAILLDVRTPEEYRSGRIPGSINVPLQQLNQITSVVTDRGTPLFTYCQGGTRSQQAVAQLKQMGYANAINIGGIGSYHGPIER